MRILGEIPVRKFDDGKQPSDPDHNFDTSFLARIPADVAFTFQTIDKQGLVLNMAQTWHQLRPGEIRHDCGGCHAHSQQPTRFEDTRASKRGYKVFDLTSTTPLVTTKDRDESQRQWDADDSSGLREVKAAVVNVEYHRDIKPILARSCVACHAGENAAGNLNLDADHDSINTEQAKLPGTYYRLAADERGTFGHKPVGYDSWGFPQASRYIRKLQSRRSLLTWKIFGQRLDGFSNDDHPSESEPGSQQLVLAGKPVDTEKNRSKLDVDFTGLQMPPPEAVAGTYKSPDGKTIKVEPLSDEDRRTIARWIDLGCPIDLDFDPSDPNKRSFGWMCDDQRPTLTLNYPKPGRNDKVDRLQIGMYDYGTSLDLSSFTVTADIAIDGVSPGTNLASKFKSSSEQVWEWRLNQPLAKSAKRNLTLSVRDGQGNTSRIARTFSVGP
jgi:hypothetical protein